MNTAWRNADADAHRAKAEAIDNALAALDGLDGALDNIEGPVIENTLNVLKRARELHEAAAKLRAVA